MQNICNESTDNMCRYYINQVVPGADFDENVRVPSHSTHAGIFDCVLDEQSEIRAVSPAPAVRHPLFEQ